MRRQTAAHAGERELQVLDYQNTAADLLPLLAQAYALLFMVRLPTLYHPFYCTGTNVPAIGNFGVSRGAVVCANLEFCNAGQVWDGHVQGVRDGQGPRQL